jgi:hypothetical protein
LFWEHGHFGDSDNSVAREHTRESTTTRPLTPLFSFAFRPDRPTYLYSGRLWAVWVDLSFGRPAFFATKKMPTFPAHNDVYRYQALDATRQQIRLIKLVKNTSSKRPPRCKIYTFDLASAPKYIALSYTWGPPDPSCRILVDKKAFKVRENLYNFLCSFQTGSAIRTDIAYI